MYLWLPPFLTLTSSHYYSPPLLFYFTLLHRPKWYRDNYFLTSHYCINFHPTLHLPLSFLFPYLYIIFNCSASTWMVWGDTKSSSPPLHYFSSYTVALILPLRCTPLIFIILILYSMWLFWINLVVLRRHFLFLSTTSFIFIPHCIPILFPIFLLYSVWILCINIKGLGRHFLLLTTTAFVCIIMWNFSFNCDNFCLCHWLTLSFGKDQHFYYFSLSAVPISLFFSSSPILF